MINSFLTLKGDISINISKSSAVKEKEKKL